MVHMQIILLCFRILCKLGEYNNLYNLEKHFIGRDNISRNEYCMTHSYNKTGKCALPLSKLIHKNSLEFIKKNCGFLSIVHEREVQSIYESRQGCRVYIIFTG